MQKLENFKLAEKQLNRTKEGLDLILNSFNGFIYTVSKDYKIEYLNQALMNQIGYDATGENCFQLINGFDKKCPWCVGDTVFTGKTASFEQKSPRDNRWYYYVSTPRFDNDGKVVAQQLIAIDIHEKKNKENNLEKNIDTLEQENRLLKSAVINRYGLDKIVGQSPKMQEIYNLIIDVASSNASVILYGESGTGKELVANAIHHFGKRKKHAFLPVNCGGVPENLIESEFFGYEKGAFTGANINKSGYLQIADKGTLFLDEIGEINLNIQVKLLRAIDGDGYSPLGSSRLIKPDVRIVCATNKDLPTLVQKGLIRPDFFYRINVIPIYLPPLRKRKEDIALLIYHFLKRFQTGKNLAHIPPNIMNALENYDWPGNIRELQNVIHRYVTLDRLDVFDAYAPRKDQKTFIEEMEPSFHESNFNLNDATQAFEKKIIVSCLKKNQWHQKKVASILGINRKTLYSKIKKLGIQKV